MALAAVIAASAAAALVPFRMARRVAILDGRDLLGHRSSIVMIGGGLD
jgi:hypothetical protein